jgi:tRNA (guanosine-2'-O-)-methyltransferase
MNTDLLNYLSEFVTEQRNKQFDKVLNFRSRYIAIALEDIYQPHNASAVLRTCDCFGVQDVHIIENNNRFNIEEGVAMGSSKWLSLKQYNKSSNNTITAIEQLKSEGYRIVATTLHEKETDLENFDISNGKFALFFGTELTGLSADVIQNADEFLKIPMYGFTESFNISVSAAIILHHLTSQLRNSEIAWSLSEEEKEDLKIEWLKKTIKSHELIVKRFENSKKI